MSMQRHHCMNLHMRRGRYRYQKQPIFHIKISKMPRKAFMRISNIDFLLNGTKSGLSIFSHKLTNNNGKSFSALRGRGHTPFPLAVISPPPPPLRKILDPPLLMVMSINQSMESVSAWSIHGFQQFSQFLINPLNWGRGGGQRYPRLG